MPPNAVAGRQASAIEALAIESENARRPRRRMCAQPLRRGGIPRGARAHAAVIAAQKASTSANVWQRRASGRLRKNTWP